MVGRKVPRATRLGRGWLFYVVFLRPGTSRDAAVSRTEARD
jgi:hypothetical protein